MKPLAVFGLVEQHVSDRKRGLAGRGLAGHQITTLIADQGGSPLFANRGHVTPPIRAAAPVRRGRQERLLITPLSRFRQGTPIRLDGRILFTTYATLRSDAREERVSRVQQIVDWLGRDFDGAIVFDESHAMQNAAGETSERGDRAPSQQGRAGLRLQHALLNARVLYVSATGAA